MKILLVGGNSSLAAVLSNSLLCFAEVITAGRSNCDIELDMSWGVQEFDLPNGLDCVVNLSAHFGGPDFDSILGAEEVNAIGSLKLADASMRAGGTHFVQISSIFAELANESPLHNAYSLSKRHAEELLRLYGENSGIAILILRPSRIFGEGETFRRHQPFLYALLDQAQDNQDIILNGSNDALRNFIHVQDVAEIVSRAIRLRLEGIFQCASTSNLRISEIAQAAIAACESTSKVSFNNSSSDIPDNFLEVDNNLFRLVQYFPEVSLEEGLSREVRRRRELS